MTKPTKTIITAIEGWREAVTLIQGLEAIEYVDKGTSGLEPRVEFIGCNIFHLQSTGPNGSKVWRRRRYKTRQAPEEALFDENCEQMWSAYNRNTPRASLQEPLPTKPPSCDFCVIMQATNKNRQSWVCEEDNQPSASDGDWICKCCSILNRSYCFSSIEHLLKRWGLHLPQDPGTLLSIFPKTSFRQLAFYDALSDDELACAHKIPKPHLVTLRGRYHIDDDMSPSIHRHLAPVDGDVLMRCLVNVQREEAPNHLPETDMDRELSSDRHMDGDVLIRCMASVQMEEAQNELPDNVADRTANFSSVSTPEYGGSIDGWGGDRR